MSDDILDPDLKEKMNIIASRLKEGLPEHVGFALLVFDLGEGGRMNYISNANRAGMICALKELIANFEGRRQKSAAKH